MKTLGKDELRWVAGGWDSTGCVFVDYNDDYSWADFFRDNPDLVQDDSGN